MFRGFVAVWSIQDYEIRFKADLPSELSVSESDDGSQSGSRVTINGYDLEFRTGVGLDDDFFLIFFVSNRDPIATLDWSDTGEVVVIERAFCRGWSGHNWRSREQAGCPELAVV